MNPQSIKYWDNLLKFFDHIVCFHITVMIGFIKYKILGQFAHTVRPYCMFPCNCNEWIIHQFCCQVVYCAVFHVRVPAFS